MAENASNGIKYYLRLPIDNQEQLARIRHWSHLKLAFDKDFVWVTNFELIQIESVLVKSIPYKTLFYSHSGKLFLLDSLLPDSKEPSFLWTPIERALPLRIENFNHNYFGTNEQLEIKIIESLEEERAEVMQVELDALEKYIVSAPEIRLSKIHWLLIENSFALLFGTPMLPLNGNVFWIKGNAILPVGFGFELNLLSENIDNKINPKKEFFSVWNEDSSYYLIEKNKLKPLSIASFRKTRQKTNLNLTRNEQ